MKDQSLVLRRLGLPRGLFLTIVSVLALAWTGVAGAQSAAKTAVEAAKKICNGKTITIVWEAGLQSLDPTQFSGPLWEKETGCKVKVVEVPTAEMFTKIDKVFVQKFRRAGNFDEQTENWIWHSRIFC